jgi:hypothetical protein
MVGLNIIILSIISFVIINFSRLNLPPI